MIMVRLDVGDKGARDFGQGKGLGAQNMALEKIKKSGEPSDNELAALAKAGDREAFAILIERHYDFIYKVAYQWCAHKNDAEDITQEVCLKLAKALKNYQASAKFTSWLYRIIINSVRDMQRSRFRMNRRHNALKHITQHNMPANQEEETSLMQIWQAVRQLPQKQCDAVLLVYAQELTHAQAAKILEVKESTVSTYIMQAKKSLKGLL